MIRWLLLFALSSPAWGQLYPYVPPAPTGSSYTGPILRRGGGGACITGSSCTGSGPYSTAPTIVASTGDTIHVLTYINSAVTGWTPTVTEGSDTVTQYGSTLHANGLSAAIYHIVVGTGGTLTVTCQWADTTGTFHIGCLLLDLSAPPNGNENWATQLITNSSSQQWTCDGNTTTHTNSLQICMCGGGSTQSSLAPNSSVISPTGETVPSPLPNLTNASFSAMYWDALTAGTYTGGYNANAATTYACASGDYY